MRIFRSILIALVFISLQAHAKEDRNLVVNQTAGGKRIALVIGNGDYQHSETLPKLANPPHDAEDIAAALRGFGFEVIERKNQTKKEMKEAIAEFSRKIGNSDAALFYYAGHGLQVKGQNYIVPVDADIETEASVEYEGVNVSRILDEMDYAQSRANIVMLDACRNNPISGKFRSGATRGLAAPGSTPKGTVIVYATDPGNVAADGDGRNGLFTSGLLAAFKGNDLSLHGVLVNASKEVERGSDKKQTPYINGPATLQEEFQFRQGTHVASLEPVPASNYVPPAPRVKTREEIEDETWGVAESANTVEAINAYLEDNPHGRYVTQAKVKIAALKKQAREPVPDTVRPTRQDSETMLWDEVQKGNSKDDYDAYLAQYPKGKYVALAKSRIKKLMDEAAAELEQQDQTAWNNANSTANEGSYQSYLTAYPRGRYATLAQGRIDKIKREASAAEANQRREQAAAAERQKRKAAAMPKGFVSQGGLTWMPESFNKNWSDANAYCANTAINGQTGWRLPTKDELKALYDSKAMNGQGWTLSSTWSSIGSIGGAGEHFAVNLDYGNVNMDADKYTFSVTCVR